jgi:hypothetical protein
MPADARQRVLLRRIRLLVAFFIVALVLSGLTAIPLEWETGLLARWAGVAEGARPEDYAGLAAWLARVHTGLVETYARYPFMAYGTDWLAFAHVILGILFVGALRDPVRNLWVISFGMIACILVIPLALVMGPIRGIPLYWQLIDCGFGVAGVIPLWLCRRYAVELSVRAAAPGE